MVIGAKEEDGKLVRPITGIDERKLDGIQKEMLQYCKYLSPVYLPETQPGKYEGKWLLLVWCPGGYDRPYRCPKVPS